jgi:hypothetical protein
VPVYQQAAGIFQRSTIRDGVRKIICDADGSASCTIIHPAGFGSRSSCASYSLELHLDTATEHTKIIITNLRVVDAVVPWMWHDFV